MNHFKNLDYNDNDKIIEYLEKNPLNYYPKDDKQIIYHVYWYGNITRKQILCVNSYLATQNLDKTILWIWLDYTENTIIEITFENDGDDCGDRNLYVNQFSIDISHV